MPPDQTDASDSCTSAEPLILVLGASGYVGGRLVPELVRLGRRVRCMTRDESSLDRMPWSDAVEIVEGDLFDARSLTDAFTGVSHMVYLVHSLDDGADFEASELECATNARQAATDAGVERIVYLSGLGDDEDNLSMHLRSRHSVGSELASSSAELIEVRAAVILGAGSASFEMLRGVTEVLPVMITPRWVNETQLQPIAIADVLTYLVAALDITTADVDARPGHTIIEVGAGEPITYADLILTYARVAGLSRRLIPVPVLSPGLSSHWVNLITPLPKKLAAALISSLKNDVIVTDESARQLSPITPMSVDAAIEAAMSAVADLDIPTRWTGGGERQRSAREKPWDPAWAGGTLYEDCRERTTVATSGDVQRTVQGIGGARGWYGFGGLWAFRGVLDQLVGGVGLRRGRRHPDDITVGEALDFWRVDELGDDLFRLRAEMKLPGQAWLEWETTAEPDGSTRVVQRARYAPRGLLGRAYWWSVWPFHGVIFPIMLRRIVAAAEQDN